MTPPRGGWALVAAMATGVQVGAAIVATRYVVHDFGASSLALLRYVIAFACLVPFMGRLRFPVCDLVAIVVLGVFQFAVLITLLNIGLRHMSAGRAALIFATLPLLTLLLASLLGREEMTGAKAAGVTITIAGVAGMLGESLFAAAGGREWVGAAAVFGAALCGAVCSVLYRPYLERYPAVRVGAAAMLASVIVLTVPAAAEGLFSSLPHTSPAGWASVLFIGLSSGLGYVLWLWALAHATPTRVTVFLSLSPATAVLFGALLLGEPVTAGTFAGLVAVIAGLYVATRDPARDGQI